jgi:uroporphyrinogen-III synthase
MPPAPLRGRSVVVTRARAPAGALTALLRRAGADPIDAPAIRIAPPEDLGPLERAIDGLDGYEWLLFTSQNAVAAFMERLAARGRSPAHVRRLRLAVIGPATARALDAYGLVPAVAPQRFVAEALVDAVAEALAAHPASRGARMLLPRAAEARSTLPEGLRALGARVDVVPVYRVEVEREQSPHNLARVFDAPVDAVTFTSPSTVRGFLELAGMRPAGPRTVPGSALVACIGPVTAAAAAARGLRVDVIAKRYTIPGLVEALVERLGPVASAAG